MPKHPADIANAAIIARAVRYDVTLFIGRGKYAHAAARTLDEARNVAAPALEAEHPYGRRAMIYAIDADGRSALVTDDIPTENKESSVKTYAKKFNAARAAKAAGLKDGEFEVVKAKNGFAWRDLRNAKLAPDPARLPKVTQQNTAPKQPRGKRAAIEAAAREGKLPEPPDFSAPTHARFRNKLARLVELAKIGDIEGLKAVQINPASTSPKAMARYRDLCVIALEARKK